MPDLRPSDYARPSDDLSPSDKPCLSPLVLSSDVLSSDVWGLVLGFALRLDLLDLQALRDLTSFARVCRASAAGLRRVLTASELSRARLRVRVHRLFGFRDPKKTEFRPFFPDFAVDPVYTQARNLVPLSLPLVSRRLAEYAEAPGWVSWAEARPRRLNERKRKLEADNELRAQKRKLVEAELEQRGLAYDPTSGPVTAFCNGTLKTMDLAIQEAETTKRNNFVRAFVDARDVQLGPANPQQISSLAAQLRIPLDIDIRQNAPWALPPSYSAPRALGALWLRQKAVAWAAPHLEDQVALRAGEAILSGEDLDLVGESLAWVKAVSGVLTKYKNKYSR